MNCPRCGFQYVEDETINFQTTQQIANCAYCSENYRRLCDGKRVLPEPTEEFPAWSPEEAE